MQTSKQLCYNSQSAKRFKSELKVLKRFFWYRGCKLSVGVVMMVATTNVL